MLGRASLRPPLRPCAGLLHRFRGLTLRSFVFPMALPRAMARVRFKPSELLGVSRSGMTATARPTMAEAPSLPWETNPPSPCSLRMRSTSARTISWSLSGGIVLPAALACSRPMALAREFISSAGPPRTPCPFPRKDTRGPSVG